MSSPPARVIEAELPPCPAGSCTAHWERRHRIVLEFRAGLCRWCFLGRPLPPLREIDDRASESSSHNTPNPDESFPPGALVSLGLAAQLLGVPLAVVAGLCEVGKVRGEIVGPHRWMIEAESLLKWRAEDRVARAGGRDPDER